MLFKSNITLSSKRPVAFIYDAVFNSSFSIYLVIFLFISFFIQPIHLAYANEAEGHVDEVDVVTVADDVVQHNDVENETQTVEPEIDEEVTEELAIDTNTDAADSEVISEADTNVDEEQTLVSQTPPPSESIQENLLEENISSSSSDDQLMVSLDNSSTTEDAEEVVQNSPDDSDVDVVIASNEVATSSEPEKEALASATTSKSQSTSTDISTQNQDLSESSGGSATVSESIEINPQPTNSTTTQETAFTPENEQEYVENEVDDTAALDEQIGVVNKVEYLVTEENYYQFSKQSCVAVGDGAYHCSVSTGDVLDSQAVVYSSLGESGTSEIFIRTAKGKVHQITDDNYDDSSPHYDAESQRIVWQRLIDGRYQIIVYDLNDGEETQLTFSRTNNMEPAVSTNGVVWQSWDSNDWEIMFFDGTYTDQITNNATQDVAPVIQDEYIIWTVIGSDTQYAQVYSVITKEIVTITNHEGGSIVNPRFVLVYDTKFDNGDTITQGFDPETGFSSPISAKPAEPPLDIPDTDSTGEVRALIQNKSSTKESVLLSEAEPMSGDDGLDSVATSTLNLKTSSSSAETAIQLASTSIDVLAEEIIEQPNIPENQYIELDEYDLILTPSQGVSGGDSLQPTTTPSTQD